MIQDRHRLANAGFSLIEVAMALLVAGVGLLSVFALFPAGLDMNKKAIDDSQSGLYAQDVINSFRALNVKFSDLDTASIKCTAPTVWKNYGSLTVAPGTGVNSYEFAGAGTPDYTIRYTLQIGSVPQNPNLKYIRVSLLTGEAGPTNSPAVFYTEVYNTDLSW